MFISWLESHGRSEGLARELGMPAVFITGRGRLNNALVRYCRAAAITRRQLRLHSPEVVIVMLPPAPALLSVLIGRRRGTRVIADLHTGFFTNPKWRWFARIGLWLQRNSAVVVTNGELGKVCERAGVKAFVLHDLLVANVDERADCRYILCPLSYANDEPVQEILEAAKSLRDMKFVLTGRPPQKFRDIAPSNVEFVGYVDAMEFDRLVRMATLVIALTKREHTMQRAGYEALMAGKPQVTSNFSVLREFLAGSAAYADPNSPSDIGQQVRDVVDNRRRYQEEAEVILQSRIKDQRVGLESLSDFITDRSTGNTTMQNMSSKIANFGNRAKKREASA